MKTTRKSANQEPPPNGKPSKTSPSSPDAEEAGDRIRQAMMLLKPLCDFHQSVDGARMDDLRIYWDVRIIRGKDTPFAHVTGSSSLPRVLAYNMVANAPSLIQGEVTDKIMIPLTSVMQEEGERQALGDAWGKKADGPGGGSVEDLCEEDGD